MKCVLCVFTVRQYYKLLGIDKIYDHSVVTGLVQSFLTEKSSCPCSIISILSFLSNYTKVDLFKCQCVFQCSLCMDACAQRAMCAPTCGVFRSQCGMAL